MVVASGKLQVRGYGHRATSEKKLSESKNSQMTRSYASFEFSVTDGFLLSSYFVLLCVIFFPSLPQARFPLPLFIGRYCNSLSVYDSVCPFTVKEGRACTLHIEASWLVYFMQFSTCVDPTQFILVLLMFPSIFSYTHYYPICIFISFIKSFETDRVSHLECLCVYRHASFFLLLPVCIIKLLPVV